MQSPVFPFAFLAMVEFALKAKAATSLLPEHEFEGPVLHPVQASSADSLDAFFHSSQVAEVDRAAALNPQKALVTLLLAHKPESAFNLPATHSIINKPLIVDEWSRPCRPRRDAAGVPFTMIVNQAKPPKLPNKWDEAAAAAKVEFHAGCKDYRSMKKFNVNGWPLPEIAFAGRSNVGKSSALNILVGKGKKAAVVGKTPGRTRMINHFRVGNVCSIADLPGYGFAKASDSEQESWKAYITGYLRNREELKVVLILVDAQRDPQNMDADLLDFLDKEKVPWIVVATKSDKLSKSQLEESLQYLYESLALPEGMPVAFSGKTGAGKQQLWSLIKEYCMREKQLRPGSRGVD